MEWGNRQVNLHDLYVLCSIAGPLEQSELLSSSFLLDESQLHEDSLYAADLSYKKEILRPRIQPSLKELRSLYALHPHLHPSLNQLDERRSKAPLIPGSTQLRARARQALVQNKQQLFYELFTSYGHADQLGWLPDRDHQLFWRDIAGHTYSGHEYIEHPEARLELIGLHTRTIALNSLGELPHFPSLHSLPQQQARDCAELHALWLARQGKLHILHDLAQQRPDALMPRVFCHMLEGNFSEAHRQFSECISHSSLGLQIIQYHQLEASLLLGILNAILRKSSASIVQKWIHFAEQSIITPLSWVQSDELIVNQQFILEELEALDLVLNRHTLPAKLSQPSEHPLLFFLHILTLGQLNDPHTQSPSAQDITTQAQALAQGGDHLFAHYLCAYALSHELVEHPSQRDILLSLILPDIAPLAIRARRSGSTHFPRTSPTQQIYWDIHISSSSSRITAIEAHLLRPEQERERRGRSLPLEQLKMGQYDDYTSEHDRELIAHIKQDYSHANARSYLSYHGFASLAQHPRLRIVREDGTLSPLILHAQQAEMSIYKQDSQIIIHLPSENDFQQLQRLGENSYSILCTHARLESLRIALGAPPRHGRYILEEKNHPRIFQQLSLLERTTTPQQEHSLKEQIIPVIILRYRAQSLHIQLGLRIHPNSPIYTSSSDECESFSNPPEPDTYRIQRSKSEEERALSALIAHCPSLATPRDTSMSMSAWTRDIDGLAASLHCLRELQLYRQQVPALELLWQGSEPVHLLESKQQSISLTCNKTMQDWLALGSDLQLDEGSHYSIAELLQLYEQRAENFLPLGKGRYLILHDTQLQQLHYLASICQKKGTQLLVPRTALLSIRQHWQDVDLSSDLRLLTHKLLQSQPWSAPETLHAQLRPYQEQGVRWLYSRASMGIGCCLADDMGLGKTLQVIALLLSTLSQRPSLIIVPLSLIHNWKSEIERFAPSLRVHLHRDRARRVQQLAAGDIYLISYGQLLHNPSLADIEWNGLILDEAQAIKNPSSKRSDAAKRLRAAYRVCITGTPIENHLGDLWSLIHFLHPGLLGTYNHFRRRVRDQRTLAHTHSLISPLILRRSKQAVLTELPKLTEITIPITLTENERNLYEAVRRRALRHLEKEESSTIHVLAELTKLRRLCCHPSLVHPEYSHSSKLERLIKLLRSLRENGHKVLVFSQFTDMLQLARKQIISQLDCTPLYLDGSTPPAQRANSIEQFQAPQQNKHDIFLISLKAGGSGLNLTSADYIILLDPWWNPATEAQAAARAHRLGQLRPVTLYRLICTNSVEERIIQLHQQKQELMDELSQLSRDALHSLLKEDYYI